MSDPTNERLYNLLPAIYRVRDVAEGEPLRALLAVIETELQSIEADIDGLYDNWFIETCAEWVVPYIGDLLGVRGLPPVSPGPFSRRAYVANTLTYRRRKGTAAVLEQLARDTTGWPARAVEFFQLLAVTQHLNHVRPENITAHLHSADRLEMIGGPFERVAYTAEVRSIAKNRGKYNIPNVGLFLWRLQSYAVRRGTARNLQPADRRYTFHPLGYDALLFNEPQTEEEITHLAEEINVPGILRRRPLYDELEARRQSIASGETPRAVYFGENPVLQVVIHDTPGVIPDPVLPEEILICDLSDWRQPPASLSYQPGSGGSPVAMPIRVAVDPVLGRLTLPSLPGDAPLVEVSYSYGFSGDIGGGPYGRRDSLEKWLDPLDRPVTWQMGVTKDQQILNDAPDPSQLVQTIGEAIAAWRSHVAGNPDAFGVITIMDSAAYEEDLTTLQHHIEIPEGSKLAIVAAGWPVIDTSDPFIPRIRLIGQLAPEGLRPHLRGNLSVLGTAPSGSRIPGSLVLDGLLIEGSLTVPEGNLGSLLLAHCTLVPGSEGLTVNTSAAPGQQNDRLNLTLDHSICGPLTLPEILPELRVMDSIIDASVEAGGPRPAIAANTTGDQPGPPVTLERVTVFGDIYVREIILASESIFTTPVVAVRRQTGCVRFSFVPDLPPTRTPRRYQCQPDLALEDIDDPAEQARIRTRLTPSFTSTRYGDPGYAQISLTCAQEIRTGAEDGSEMGAFCYLKQPQREATLRTALEEYLRFGLEAGIFYVT